MTSRRGDNDDALSFGSPLRDELPRRRYYRSFNDRSTPRIECAVYPLVHTSFNYIEGGGGASLSWNDFGIRFANFLLGSFIFLLVRGG